MSSSKNCSSSPRIFRGFGSLGVLLFAIGVSWFDSAVADPTPGFVEHWNSGTTATWGGGDSYSNPGTGGQLGASDGYLLVTVEPTPNNFATTSSAAPYSGNWLAAGVTRVKFWLNNVGSPNGFEIHFGIGSSSDFWQDNTGFIPPVGSWAQFTVDLTDSTHFTRTLGTGSFAQAIQNVFRINIRHDLAPYTQSPDPIAGTLGIDELSIESGASTAVPPPHAPLTLDLAAPVPNPSRGPVALALDSPDASPITIEIVDVAGRLVRHVALAGMVGRSVWSWDGRGDDGAVTPAGVYRARAWNASGGMSRPLVRIAGAR